MSVRRNIINQYMHPLPTTSNHTTMQTQCLPKTNETTRAVLKRMGFENITKVTDTLQGRIYRATQILNHSVVIKTTNKDLHKNGTSSINGETNHSEEDINSEQRILNYLTQSKRCPKSIVKFHKFFETNTDYCLVMEDGGSSLFKFIKRCHKLIKKGKISISHWQQVIKVIFRQMIECINYIHSKKVCHFDISLENFLINDVKVIVQRKRSNNNKYQMTFSLEDIRVKLCDFGLAELFPNTHCKSSKYVGKEQYASPEVIANKKRFDAKKNDIWCIGVCLFIMSTGMTPFKSASKASQSFKCVVEYERISDVLIAWNILDYVDEELLMLFKSIFKYETHRTDLKGIKKQMKQYK